MTQDSLHDLQNMYNKKKCHMKRFFITLLLLTCSSVCAESHITVTGRPLQLILKEITGDTVKILNIVPSGISPEVFEPKPSDIKIAARSLALFYISDHVDGWAKKIQSPKTYESSNFIPKKTRITSGEGSHGFDTHFWTDPSTVSSMIPGFTAALCEAEPARCKLFHNNASAFTGKLKKLEQSIQTALASHRGKYVILMHPTFRYFLKSYDLQLAGSIERTAGQEPSARHMASLVKNIKKHNIRCVFADRFLPAQPAHLLASSAGVRVVMLDSYGAEDTKDFESFILFNVHGFQEGLK